MFYFMTVDPKKKFGGKELGFRELLRASARKKLPKSPLIDFSTKVKNSSMPSIITFRLL